MNFPALLQLLIARGRNSKVLEIVDSTNKNLGHKQMLEAK